MKYSTSQTERVVTGFAIVLASASPASSPTSRPPASAQEIKVSGAVWFLRKAEGECVLRSPVIGGEAISHVEVSTGLYDDRVSGISLAPTDRLKKAPITVGVKFGNNTARPFKAFRHPGKIGDARIGISFMSEEDKAIDLADGTPILLGIGAETIGIRTKSIAPKLKALRECEAEQLASVGVDPTILATIKTPPKAKKPFASLFSTDDYPRMSVIGRESGPVRVALLIDEAGNVSKCVVIASSGFRLLDQATCKPSSRMKYEPALDANGEPVPSVHVSRVVWSI